MRLRSGGGWTSAVWALLLSYSKEAAVLRRLLLIIFALSLGVAGRGLGAPQVVQAQTASLSWSQNQFASPPARDGAGMAYDAYTGTVLLFGGIGSVSYLNDTWSYPTLPAVTGLYPSNGPAAGGSLVTIAGSGFSTSPGGMAVTFGAVAAPIAAPPSTGGAQTASANASVSCASSTLCFAVSPPGSGIVDVTVTVNGRTSLANAGDQFTYLVTPSVSGVSPSSGPLGGGTPVTISGANLSAPRETTNISFGGVAAIVTSCPSSSVCYAVSPAGAATGAVGVLVSVTGISPSTGPAAGGTVVTISGSNLSASAGPTTIRFGAQAATAVSCTSSISCTATSPAGGSGATVDVTVSVLGQTSATGAADQFTYASGSVAQQFSVQPSTRRVYAGQDAPLTLQTTGSTTPLGAWTVDIGYDPTVLTPTQCVAETGVPADLQTQCNLSYGPSTVRVAQSTASGITGVQGVAVITFSGIGAAGAASTLTPKVDALSTPSGVAVASSV